MGQYKSQHTGPQIDAGVDAALNPDLVPKDNSDALITSDAVAKVQQGFAPIETDATAAHAYAIGDLLVWGGILYKAKTAIAVNDSFAVGTNIEATTVADRLSALDAKADKNDLATIHQTSPTCTETNGIAAGVFFYLDNELVVAKTAIANGATFTNGTNYESPTAGGLNALKSAFKAGTVIYDTGFLPAVGNTWTNTGITGTQLSKASMIIVAVQISSSMPRILEATTAPIAWYSEGTNIEAAWDEDGAYSVGTRISGDNLQYTTGTGGWGAKITLLQ